MATKEDIIALPHAHLRSKSKKITAIDKQLKALVEEMKQATLDWENSREHEVGVALAAVQIDQPYRVIVVRNDFENKEDKSFSVFINPEIIKLEGEVEDDFEGCLSVRDIYGKVPRYNKVKIKARDELGRDIRVKAEGFLARVLQHEVDHTNGIMFVDHIVDQPDSFYKLTDDGKLVSLPYEQLPAGIFRD